MAAGAGVAPSVVGVGAAGVGPESAAASGRRSPGAPPVPGAAAVVAAERAVAAGAAVAWAWSPVASPTRATARRNGRARAAAATVPRARRAGPAGRQPSGSTTAAGRVEQALDRAREPGLGQVADDPGALDEADLAVLLGDDDDDRVGLLGDPEGRPMPRPEPLGVDRRLGQRQERAGRDDPVVADDDRAVVERRLRA